MATPTTTHLRPGTRVWLPSRTEGWPGYYGTVLSTRDGRQVEVQFEQRIERDFSMDELRVVD